METSTYERWPVDKPIVKENVRKHFSEESLHRHSESLKKDGQLRPLLVLRDCTLVAGERTLRAAILAGLTHVDVKILDGEFSPGEIKKLQLVENLMREGLTDPEVYLGCSEWRALNPGCLKKDLMAELHFDASMATRIFAVDKLIPAAKEAFLGGVFRFSQAYDMSKVSEKEQHEMLAAILAGTPRDEIKRQVGKPRNGKAGTVTVRRIKCPVPGKGTTVTVSGEGISLEDMIDAMQELLKKAKKASEQGWDCKTFERACRDEARA